jgi:hypothetical protein
LGLENGSIVMLGLLGAVLGLSMLAWVETKESCLRALAYADLSKFIKDMFWHSIPAIWNTRHLAWTCSSGGECQAPKGRWP